MATDEPHREIVAIVEAVQIRSPSLYLFRDTPTEVDTTRGTTPDDPWHHEDPLASSLSKSIYLWSHCGLTQHDRDFETTGGAEVVDIDVAPEPLARGPWDTGWKLRCVGSGGTVFAEKSGRIGAWSPGQFISESVPVRISEGDLIRVFRPRRSGDVQGGFIFFFGTETSADGDTLRIVRLYINTQARAAPRAVPEICRGLDRYRVPYTLKSARYSRAYDRRDSTVIYVGARYVQIVAWILSELYSQIRGGLNAEVPPLTRRLAPGIALAEDPGTGESFGAHRAWAITAGLIEAHRLGSGQLADRLQSVRASFEHHDIAWNQPYRRSMECGFRLDEIEMDIDR